MKLRKRNLIILIFAILCVGLSSRSWTADRPSDETITFWIKEALHEDPRIDASEVNVETDSDLVTLTGIVKNLAAKKYADSKSKKFRVYEVLSMKLLYWGRSV